LPVGVGVALGDLGAGAALDVAGAVLEGAEVDETTLLDPARSSSRGDVEDEIRSGASGDRRGDGLLGALTSRDLLGLDLLIGVVGIPCLNHRLAPGDFLLVVGQPDLDRAACLLRSVAAPAVAASTGGESGGNDRSGDRGSGEGASVDVHR